MEGKITLKKYRKALGVVKQYQEQVRREIIELYGLQKANRMKIYEGIGPETLVYDVRISVRLLNGIRVLFWYSNYHPKMGSLKIKDLSEISLRELIRIRGIGKRSIEELQDICECAEIILKQ